MRSRNLQARSEMIYLGVMTRSRKGNKVNVEMKVGDCWQWTMFQRRFVFVSIMVLKLPETGANLTNKKSDRPLLHLIRRQHQTERENQNHLIKKDGDSVDKRSKVPCRWTNPSCSYRNSPVCQNYISEAGCRHGRNCYFRHVELEEKPSNKSKKELRKDQLQC